MASILLHNFIIDHCTPYCMRDKEYFVNFNAIEELEFLHCSNAAKSNIGNEELAIDAVADNDATKPTSQLPITLKQCQEQGEQLREMFRLSLSVRQFTHPNIVKMTKNSEGILYCN